MTAYPVHAQMQVTRAPLAAAVCRSI